MGPALTLALAAGLYVLGPAAHFVALAAALLTLAVVLAAGLGGQRAALAAAGLGWFYFVAAYFSGWLPSGLALVVVLALILPAAAWIAGWLGNQWARQQAGRQAQLAEHLAGRARAESTLERDRQIWASVLAAVPDFIYVKDRQGRYLLTSQAMAATLGAASPEAVVGKTDFDFCAPALAEQYRAEDVAILQSGQSKVSYEAGGLDKNGREVWSLTTKAPWRDADGAILGIIGVGRDITERRRAEAALRAAESQYRSLVEQLPAVTYLAETGEQARLLYVSPQVESILGIPAAEFSVEAQAWLARVHAGDRDRVRAALGAAGGAGAGLELDYRVQAPDGSLRWLRHTTARLAGPESGQRTCGILLDITAHKQAEEAVRLIDERLQLVAWATNDAVWDMDLKTRQVWWNDGLRKLFQYDPAGISHDESWWQERIHADERERVIGGLERALAGTDQFWSKEYRFRRADGTYAHVFDRGYIVRDERQAPLRVVGAMMDVSERRRIEEALREAQSRYGTLVEQLPDVVYLAQWGEAGRWIYVSPKIESLLGFSPQEWLADPSLWARQLHPDDRQRVFDDEAHDRQRDIGSTSINDYRLFTRDGRTIWVRDSAVLLPGEPGQPPLYHGVLSDVTAERRTQEALQAANRVLTQWLQHSEQRTMELGLLNELNGLLQNCHDVNEACQIAAPILRRLFADESLGLYLLSSGPPPIRAEPVWPDQVQPGAPFELDDCWALRRNQIYLVDAGHPGPLCAHVAAAPPPAYLCAPISAQGRPRALLHTHKPWPDASGQAGDAPAFTDAQRQLARTVADAMGLAFSNLELRDRLREQSIRDALTGLYNRRYMEESLEREILRAMRQNAPVGIVMLDIDHFKPYNDAYGHAAGDVLLRDLGRLLRQQIRGADIACRYGGEEFTLILPEASLEVTRLRAEQVRQAVPRLRPELDGKYLNSVTVSLGVAAFPDHGGSAEQVLRAADEVLYEAKRAGRNRVVAQTRSSPFDPPKT